MKKTPKLDLNSFDFEGSNHDKLFLANYHELRKTYEELFYEELKESAEKAWLSGDDWKIFVKHALSWDDYTDFFKFGKMNISNILRFVKKISNIFQKIVLKLCSKQGFLTMKLA